jgi:hypothetical protein
MKRKAMMADVRNIMIEFADQTGLSPTTKVTRRYLWTDAFAVCNFLTLYRQTGEEEYKNLALSLIDQVHNILGRHRADDPRTGWISSLGEEEGQSHPTAGGLRIGKKLNERGPSEPFDERLEWERDGQYYHYLTKWMHALERVGVVTSDHKYCRWSVELAEAAHAGFTYGAPTGGAKRMYWKMSIDLTRPLVPSMGLHDPLDGFVTYNELRLCTERTSDTPTVPDLSAQIVEMAKMCEGQNWETDDPLGMGGLLFDACRMFQMTVKGHFRAPTLLEVLLRSSQHGLNAFFRQNPLNDSADYRLAFRELGLSIGLKAVAKMRNLCDANPGLFDESLSQKIDSLMRYVPFSETIETFWQRPVNQQAGSWIAHHDINMTMLATSLSPDEFLSL